MRIDALRALARWGDALARGRELPAALPERAAPRRGAVQEGGGDGEGGAGGERRARPRPRRHRDLPPGLGRGARWRPGAIAPPSAWSRSRPRCPPPRRPVVRARTAGELVTRGMVLLRPQPEPGLGGGVRVRAAPRPGLDAGPGVPGALPPRAVGLEAAPAPARGAAVRRGRGRLRAGREQRSARQGAVPGRALLRDGGQPRGGAGALRARRGRARRPQLRRRRAHPRGGAGDRRRATRRPPRSCWRRSRPAIRRATCSTRRCGGWRSAAWRAGRDDEALRWLDENLRLVPHEEIWYAEGRAQYWKGRVFEKRGKPDEARAWYERAVREYPLSVYALLSLTRLKALDPAAQKALVGSLRKGLHDVPAWSFPPRALYGDAGLPARRRAGAHGPGRRRAPRADTARAGRRRPRSARRRPRAPRTRISIWITSMLLDRGGVWSASHSLPRYGADQLQARVPEGASARRSGSSPTRARSRRWSPRTPRPTSCPKRCSWRSCARRARSRRASNRSPTRSG